MDQELKKATMLLKSLIFHYHGLDDDESKLLEVSAKKLDAKDELTWANNFIARDYMSAFDRSKEYFFKTIGKINDASKLQMLMDVWEDNHKKGYVTEMETTAMINLSKDWGIDKEFLQHINH